MPGSLGWPGIVQRRWFQTLVSGLVLFYVVQRVVVVTQNLHLVPTLLLLGAFLTPVAFVTYVYERQPVRAVPLATVAICFFWGGAVGAVVAGLLEYEALRRLDALGLFKVATIEEAGRQWRTHWPRRPSTSSWPGWRRCGQPGAMTPVTNAAPERLPTSPNTPRPRRRSRRLMRPSKPTAVTACQWSTD